MNTTLDMEKDADRMKLAMLLVDRFRAHVRETEPGPVGPYARLAEGIRLALRHTWTSGYINLKEMELE
jgi:hypothetical protein